jgi:DNA polymerase III sliding clamp (beta) subunit (PCNA family)
MANFTALVPVDAIKAAMLSMSKEETRYYLRGVLFQRNGDVLRLISTDGHRLFVFAMPVDADAPAGDFEAILPDADLKRALTGIHKTVTHLDFSCDIPAEGERVKSAVLNSLTMAPIDGTFPHVSRVIPSDGSDSFGTVAHFNPAYLADVGKQAKLLTGSATSFHLQHSGGDPALVTFAGRADCFSVVMPMRSQYCPPHMGSAVAVALATCRTLAPVDPERVAAE